MKKLRVFFRIIKDIWKLSKINLIISVCTRIILSLIPSYKIIILAGIVNSFSTEVNSNSINHILLLLLLYVSLSIIDSLLSNVNKLLDFRLTQLWSLNINQKMLRRMSNFDLEFYEKQNSYDHIRIAQMGQNSIHVFNSGMSIFQNLITITSMFIILFNINIILPFILIVGIIPAFITSFKLAKYRYTVILSQSPEERQASYLSSLFMRKEAVKEIRLYKLSSYFINKWKVKFKKQQDIKYTVEKKEVKNSIIISVTQQLVYVIVFGYMFYLIKNGTTVSSGSFISTLQTLTTIQGLLQGLVMSIVLIFEQIIFASELYNLLDSDKTNNTSNNQIDGLHQNISVDNLSFSYSNGKEVLHNISFEIKPLSRIVIVGANGSGKSTLSKCLSGLYRSYSGNINWDGVDIKTIDKDSFYNQLSCVFQDYMKYQLTIRENVGLSNLENIEYNEKIIESLNKSGLEMLASVDNLDNNLGVEFGTRDLSEGQWQRLAVSRALFRKSSLIILDEPTSAIDPIAEIQLYKDFIRVTEDKTSIFISHRMGVCKSADLILVMKDGRLIEQGTHCELMDLNGEYKTMFESQSSLYK